MSQEEYVGDVVWFHIEQGYGFIARAKDGQVQKDMFVHYSDIEMDGFKQLKAGQKVTFKIGYNNAGQPKAVNVRVIE
jgi:cold shock protein